MSKGTHSQIKSIKTVSAAVSLVSAIAFMAVPAMSNAAGFTFDGVRDGDPYSKAFDVKWFDGHGEKDSAYPKSGTQTTTVRYGEGQEGTTGDTFSWLFLEVPLYAKNMVWGDAFDPDENPDGADAANALLAGYGKALDFGGATGSEKVEFGAKVGDPDKFGIELDLAAGDFKDESIFTVVGFRD